MQNNRTKDTEHFKYTHSNTWEERHGALMRLEAKADLMALCRSKQNIFSYIMARALIPQHHCAAVVLHSLYLSLQAEYALQQ